MSGRLIEWGVAQRPFANAPEGGDLHVLHVAERHALAGVVDGLGHGLHAATAAKVAAEAIDASPNDSLESLFAGVHERLRDTRGAVMTLLRFDAETHTVNWLGVGDVRAVLRRANPVAAAPIYSDLVLRAGIVGLEPLPPLAAATVSVRPGDTLVVATDGVDRDFMRDIPCSGDLQVLAERLLAQYGYETDDSLVLAVRYRGD